MNWRTSLDTDLCSLVREAVAGAHTSSTLTAVVGSPVSVLHFLNQVIARIRMTLRAKLTIGSGIVFALSKRLQFTTRRASKSPNTVPTKTVENLADNRIFVPVRTNVRAGGFHWFDGFDWNVWQILIGGGIVKTRFNVSAPAILSNRYCFQMFGTHTVPTAAKMIDLKAIGDSTDAHLISETMRGRLRPSRTVFDGKHPVSISPSAADPQPTSCIGRLYSTPKTTLFSIFINHRGIIPHSEVFA